MKKFNWRNDFVLLFPLLVFYIILIWFWQVPHKLVGDEGRYLYYAQNLLDGFYSPIEADNVFIWNGPGFPLLLAPFVALGWSFFKLRLLNALWWYLALVLILKTIRPLFRSRNKGFILVCCLGCFFPAWQMLRFIHTESLTLFLVALIIFLFLRVLQKKNSFKTLLLSGFTLGFLALVKVAFGYGLFALFFILSFIMLFKSLRTRYYEYWKIFSIAVLICVPYLVYTYSLTNKIFYWSSSGGSNLYAISSLAPEETGSWMMEKDWVKLPYHKQFVNSLSKMNLIQKDSAYKAKAVENIIKNPIKYSKNVIGNISRVFLGHPLNYQQESINSLFYIVPGCFLFVFTMISWVLTFINRKSIPDSLLVILTFFIFYVLITFFISAFARMLHVLLPFLIYLIAWNFSKYKVIKA